MPNFSADQLNRVITSAGSVIQSRYWTRLPSLVIQRVAPRATLPISAGGLGGRFFSLRRSGVAGSGSGGVDSPPVWCWGLADRRRTAVDRAFVAFIGPGQVGQAEAAGAAAHGRRKPHSFNKPPPRESVHRQGYRPVSWLVLFHVYIVSRYCSDGHYAERGPGSQASTPLCPTPRIPISRWAGIALPSTGRLRQNTIGRSTIGTRRVPLIDPRIAIRRLFSGHGTAARLR